MLPLIFDTDQHITEPPHFWTSRMARKYQDVAPNERALRLYESAGFQREGVRRQAYFMAGRHVDVGVMGCLREAYGITS